MRKKFFSLTLVLCMALMMLPTTVLAVVPAYNPYYIPPEGKATPASPQGTTAAVPYEFNEKELAGEGSTLFDSKATQFKAEFISPVEGENYGTVTFNDNAVQYTPNELAAGKTIQFKVYAADVDNDWSSGGITFTVKVNNQPTDASANANLTTLSYQIGDGAFIAVPDFSKDTLEYTVVLPEGTALGQTITLRGICEDEKASVNYTTAKTAWIANGEKATAEVTAENTATQKKYKVNFYVKPADREPRVFLSSETAFKDGDTITMKTDETKKLWVSLGSGDTAAGSASIRTSDFNILPVTWSFTGLYPNTVASHNLKLDSGEKADLTISFYKGDCTKGSSTNPDDTTPYKTMVLHIVHHDHSVVKTEAKASTCTADGNIEYWYCADCDKYFDSAELTNEITKESTVVKATGHAFKDGVCTVCKEKDPNYKPSADGDSTETGDDSNLAALAILMAAAMAAASATVLYGRRKREK